jgi:hypothetical protein
LSFNKIAEVWANIIGGKLFCVIGGTKLLYVVDVGNGAFLVDVQKACCHIE